MEQKFFIVMYFLLLLESIHCRQMIRYNFFYVKNKKIPVSDHKLVLSSSFLEILKRLSKVLWKLDIA